MSEESKEVHRRVFEEFRSQSRMELADELLTPDFVDHDSSTGEEFSTPEGAKEEVSMYHAAFPGLSVSVLEQEADGDRVTTTWKLTGTHDGDLMGIAPTGKAVEVTGKTVARVEGGKVAEEWHEWDVEGMLAQIGASPEDIQAE